MLNITSKHLRTRLSVSCQLVASQGLEPSHSGGQIDFSTKEHSVLHQHCRWEEREPWPAHRCSVSVIVHTSRSVVMRTRLEPERNSLMIKSLSFWSMSPCCNTRLEDLNENAKLKETQNTWPCSHGACLDHQDGPIATDKPTMSFQKTEGQSIVKLNFWCPSEENS